MEKELWVVGEIFLSASFAVMYGLWFTQQMACSGFVCMRKTNHIKMIKIKGSEG
jgi:hypothetical protein